MLRARKVAQPLGGVKAMNIKGLHHYAYRCRDAEETRAFYEDLLGLPLAHLIRLDHVPSTGEYCPYVHIFFEMQDGSFIAFFDLGDNERAEPSANTPAWVNHLALEVPDRGELLRAKARLEAAGVEVLGVTDHHIIESIYFFDPNGVRLELTVRAIEDAELRRLSLDVRSQLAAWTTEKQQRPAPT
jgi:catechol 2,3-dioxygenase-like lactoylglutathione lyase family enzyme